MIASYSYTQFKRWNQSCLLACVNLFTEADLTLTTLHLTSQAICLQSFEIWARGPCNHAQHNRHQTVHLYNKRQVYTTGPAAFCIAQESAKRPVKKQIFDNWLNISGLASHFGQVIWSQFRLITNLQGGQSGQMLSTLSRLPQCQTQSLHWGHQQCWKGALARKSGPPTTHADSTEPHICPPHQMWYCRSRITQTVLILMALGLKFRHRAYSTAACFFAASSKCFSDLASKARQQKIGLTVDKAFWCSLMHTGWTYEWTACLDIWLGQGCKCKASIYCSRGTQWSPPS